MTIYDDSLFRPASSTASTIRISVDNHISEHCQWALEHIYQKPYPDGNVRDYHSILHVSRAAMFGVVWANMFRRYDDPEACRLTDRDMKLLQIAILFHDSGRKNDGEDHWDNDSAINLYKYLTLTLGLSHDEAAKFAEACANKDHNGSGVYQKLVRGDDGAVRFEASRESRSKTIYQKIIHDSDCLDILRCAECFEPSNLDFYKAYCEGDRLPKASMDLAQIIAEARALLYTQGDLRVFEDKKKKARYQSAGGDIHSLITQDIADPENNLPLLQSLTQDSKLLNHTTLKSMTLTPIQGSLEVGDVFTLENVIGLMRHVRQGHPYLIFRGIGGPSAKPRNSKYVSLAELEIRKLLRGIGNPARSATLLPSETYTRAGLLLYIDGEVLIDIQSVSNCDIGSDRDKKREHAASTMQKEAARQALAELSRNITLEPKETFQSARMKKFGIRHNEIELTIRKQGVKGIGYSRDYSLHSKDMAKEAAIPMHPDVGLFEAYFIQQVYQRETGVTLPIFEVSYYSNHYSEQVIDDRRLLEAWQNVFQAYIRAALKNGQYGELKAMNVEQLKIMAIYGSLNHFVAGRNQSVDMYCNSSLRDQINQMVTGIKEREMQIYSEKFINCVKQFREKETDAVTYLETVRQELSLDLHVLLDVLMNLQIDDPEIQKQRDELLTDHLKRTIENKTSWVVRELRDNTKKFMESCFEGKSKKVNKLKLYFELTRRYAPEIHNQIYMNIRTVLENWLAERRTLDSLISAEYNIVSRVFIVSWAAVVNTLVKDLAFIDQHHEEKPIANWQRALWQKLYLCVLQAINTEGDQSLFSKTDSSSRPIELISPAICFLFKNAESIATREQLEKIRRDFLRTLEQVTGKAEQVSILRMCNGKIRVAVPFDKAIDILGISDSEIPRAFLDRQVPPAISSEAGSVWDFEYEYPLQVIPRLLKALMAHDEGDVVFEKLIAWIISDDFKSFYDYHPVINICNNLHALKVAMPNQEFSDNQITIIKRHLLSIARRELSVTLSSCGANSYNYSTRMFMSLEPLVRTFGVVGLAEVPPPLRNQFFIFTMAHLKLNLWHETNSLTMKYVSLFERIGIDIRKVKGFVENALSSSTSPEAAQTELMRDIRFSQCFLLPVPGTGQNERSSFPSCRNEGINKKVISLLVEQCQLMVESRKVEATATAPDIARTPTFFEGDGARKVKPTVSKTRKRARFGCCPCLPGFLFFRRSGTRTERDSLLGGCMLAKN